MTIDTKHSREATAYHEAGHAVADVRGGLGCGGVTIAADAKARSLGGAGHMNDWTTSPAPKTQEAIAQASLISLYAGFAAELRFDPKGHQAAQLGATGDFEKARELLVLLYGEEQADQQQAEWIERAKSLVADPRNWRAIEMLARELLDCGQLDGDLVDVLVDFADGEITSAQWEKRKRRHEERKAGRP